MTIHFAAARPLLNSYVGRRLGQGRAQPAANDNSSDVSSAAVLRDALKHFAVHGLGAAQHARDQAERAFFAGDRDTYQRWLGICRALDRRMAVALRARTHN